MGRNFNTPYKKEQGAPEYIAACFLISWLIRQEDHYFRKSYWFRILVAKSSYFLSHSVLYLILSFYFVNLIRPLRAVSCDRMVFKQTIVNRAEFSRDLNPRIPFLLISQRVGVTFERVWLLDLGLFQTSCYCRVKLARLQLDCSTTPARLGFRRRI